MGRQDLEEPTFRNSAPCQPVIGPKATADIQLLSPKEAAKYGLLETSKKPSTARPAVPLALGGKDNLSAAEGVPREPINSVPPCLRTNPTEVETSLAQLLKPQHGGPRLRGQTPQTITPAVWSLQAKCDATSITGYLPISLIHLPRSMSAPAEEPGPALPGDPPSHPPHHPRRHLLSMARTNTRTA